MTAVVLAAAMILILPACDDGFDLKVEFRLNLGVSPEVSSIGATIVFTFANRGDAAVQSEGAAFEFVVTDPAGNEVRRLADPSGGTSLAPGEALSVGWDQRDEAGIQVPPADYDVTARYVAGDAVRSRTTGFTIL